MFVGLVLCAPAAFAQDATRIGFVNTDRMLREAAPARAAQTKLEQEFARREKEIDDAGAALRATDGNKLAAARLLGIARATLYERLAAEPGVTVPG